MIPPLGGFQRVEDPAQQRAISRILELRGRSISASALLFEPMLNCRQHRQELIPDREKIKPICCEMQAAN